MTAEYTPLTLDALSGYQAVLSTGPNSSCDYTPSNLWGWAPHFGLQWRLDGFLYWIRQTRKQQPVNWAPIGPWHSISDWLDRPEMQPGNRFIRVPEELCLLWQQLFPERIEVEESRDEWEYLYSAEELATLPGNRFHKKKNLVNQFIKRYDYQYKPIAKACTETVLAMQAEWCRWENCEESDTLLGENDAISRVLAAWDNIPGLCGGIIRVDNVPVAYTVAEPIDDDTLVVHFEKANTSIKGAYQAINYLFANDMKNQYKFFNREQDGGNEGLRKAKLSYNPTGFNKKYTITIR